MINNKEVSSEKVYKNKWVQVEDDSDEESNVVNNDNSVVADEQNELKEWLSRVNEVAFR